MTNPDQITLPIDTTPVILPVWNKGKRREPGRHAREKTGPPPAPSPKKRLRRVTEGMKALRLRTCNSCTHFLFVENSEGRCGHRRCGCSAWRDVGHMAEAVSAQCPAGWWPPANLDPITAFLQYADMVGDDLMIGGAMRKARHLEEICPKFGLKGTSGIEERPGGTVWLHAANRRSYLEINPIGEVTYRKQDNK